MLNLYSYFGWIVMKAIKFNCFKIIATNYSQVLQSVPVWSALPNRFGLFFSFLKFFGSKFWIGWGCRSLLCFILASFVFSPRILVIFSFQWETLPCRIQIRNRCIKRMDATLCDFHLQTTREKVEKLNKKRWIITNTGNTHTHTGILWTGFIVWNCSLITER